MWTEQEEWLRSATAGFHSPKTILGEPCCDRARGPPWLGNLHSGWSCRRRWFLRDLFCCHSPAPGTQRGSFCTLPEEHKAALTQGCSKRDFPKGWMLFLTQKDTHRKHVTACLTLDNTIKRQHMVSGGQDTQPPLNGGEGTTVQERWELMLAVCETLVCSSQKGPCRLQCISSGRGAHEGSHGHSWQDGGHGEGSVSKCSGEPRGRDGATPWQEDQVRPAFSGGKITKQPT